MSSRKSCELAAVSKAKSVHSSARAGPIYPYARSYGDTSTHNAATAHREVALYLMSHSSTTPTCLSRAPHNLWLLPLLLPCCQTPIALSTRHPPSTSKEQPTFNLLHTLSPIATTTQFFQLCSAQPLLRRLPSVPFEPPSLLLPASWPRETLVLRPRWAAVGKSDHPCSSKQQRQDLGLELQHADQPMSETVMLSSAAKRLARTTPSASARRRSSWLSRSSSRSRSSTSTVSLRTCTKPPPLRDNSLNSASHRF